MKEVSKKDVLDFAVFWSGVNDQVVQHWMIWEREVAKFFGVSVAEDDTELLHRLMLIVCPVCLGTVNDIKTAIREAAPSTLRICEGLLGHLDHFAALLDAERSFRAGKLAHDWVLIPNGKGQTTVRKIYKTPTETEH